MFRFRYRFRLSHFLFGSRERIGLRLVLVILRPVRNRNIKCGVIRCIEFRILGFVLRIGFICRIGFRYILCIGILTARVILAVIVAVLCIRFRPGFIDRLSHRTATGLLFCGLLDLNDLCRSGFCLDRGLRFRRHIAFRIPGPTGLPYRIRQAIRRRGFNLFGRSAAGFRSRRIRAVICAARRSRFTGRTGIAGRCGSRYRSTRPGTAGAGRSKSALAGRRCRTGRTASAVAETASGVTRGLRTARIRNGCRCRNIGCRSTLSRCRFRRGARCIGISRTRSTTAALCRSRTAFLSVCARRSTVRPSKRICAVSARNIAYAVSTGRFTMRSAFVRCSFMPASTRRTTFGRSRSNLTAFLRRCRSGCRDRSGRNGRLVIHNRSRCTVIGCTATGFRRRGGSRSSRSS